MKKYLTVSQVAKLLKCNESTIYRKIKLNDIPHIKMGKLIRIPANIFKI